MLPPIAVSSVADVLLDGTHINTDRCASSLRANRHFFRRLRRSEHRRSEVERVHGLMVREVRILKRWNS